MLGLALAQAEQHLGLAFLEIKPQRHERQALLRRQLGEALDLAAVQEQLPRGLGLWLKRLASVYSGMSQPISQTSVSLTRA